MLGDLGPEKLAMRVLDDSESSNIKLGFQIVVQFSDAKPRLFVPQKNLWGQRTLTMYDDPIVTEVRNAGQLLAEQAEGDLHTFFELLREAQKQYQERLVQAPLRPSQAVKSGPPDSEALSA